jgi:dynein assembly factor 3
MELFVDLYGNTMIRSKTAHYLDEIAVELSRLITEHRKCKSVLMDIVDLETLKFKQRDDLEDIINTWRLSIPFDIESLRDQRVRAYFKTRYDARKNLVDWDYQFQIRKFTKFIDRENYIKFRMTGVAFETRLSEGAVPNRTMGSYIEGKKKRSGDS